MTTPSYICANCLRATRTISRNTLTRQLSQLSRGNHLRQLDTTPRQLHNAARSSTTNIRNSRPSVASAIPRLRIDRRHASSKPPTPSPANHTVAILNPRQDPEDPNTQMSIEISQRATKRLKKIMSKDSNPGLCLRVSVESGGCHGFQYLMSLTSAEKIDADEDTLFVAQEEGMDSVEGGDEYAEIGRGRAKVVMDEASLELLKGSKVDFTEELIGSQFVITENPRAVSSCGCGTSFDVKM